MKFKTILVLVLMLAVAVFSVQNAGVVTVHFLAWQFALSQALLLLLASFVGLLIGLIVGALSRGTREPPPAPTRPAELP
jgi:uncharacterized integral membrane protein